MKITNFCLLVSLGLTNNIFAANNIPSWVKNPSKECETNSICAAGTGKSMDLAKADAKNNIQKYFETKISSSFKNELSNNGKDTRELSSEFINEETSGILKGVEIKKTFEDKGIFYVFASLDKTKRANEIKADINSLDQKMLALYKEKTASSAKKLEKLYPQRLDLNKKYMFLTNKQIPEVVNYDKIFNNIKDTKNSKVSYYLDIKDSDLKAFIKNIIADNGGTVIKNNLDANIVIKGNITNKKEFLKVDGFEKYSITVELLSIKNGKVINSIVRKETDTGLSFEQIYDKCMGRITTYIEENFTNLME